MQNVVVLFWMNEMYYNCNCVPFGAVTAAFSVEQFKFRMTCECMNVSMICGLIYEIYTVFLIFNVIIPAKTKSLPVTSK